MRAKLTFSLAVRCLGVGSRCRPVKFIMQNTLVIAFLWQLD
jgi:hypothetical protein